VEKVGNYLKEDLAKPGYKSKHESTKRWGWLEWRSHGLPTSKDKSYTVVVAPIREEIIVNEGKFLVGFCFVSEGKFLVGIPVGIEHLPSY